MIDDGGEERALAAEPVADHSEDQRSERPEGEAGGEQAERRDQRRGRLEPGEEHLGDGLASAPKMKKSYHSNAVPADDATITRLIDQGLCFLPPQSSSRFPSVRRDNGCG